MENSIDLDFCENALASGLVSEAQLEQVRAALRKADSVITDDVLADVLVEQGVLSRYQAEQLAAGMRRFKLGPYVIVDGLGQGGMGHVFKAEHTVMGRVVAIKVLPQTRNSPVAIERFLREIRVQAQLDHPHLVRALDAGHEGNVHYMVTEYVPGDNLRRIVRDKGPLTMENAAWLLTQVCRGLEHAHGCGLVHRDVKPSNILVTPEGVAKVSDLGLVGFMQPSGSVNEDRSIVGTADYVSPEQVRSPDKVGPASDIYSLGCTLYYAVTGKVPYPGGTTGDKCRMHTSERQMPLDPRRLNPALSDAFVDMIGDMMAKRFEDRIPTAAACAERLKPWAQGGWTGIEGQSAGGPRIIVPPRVSAPEAPLSDTVSELLPSPERELPTSGSHGQASHGTLPRAWASEETLASGTKLDPLVELEVVPAWWRKISPVTALLVLLSLVGCGVALGVLWMILSSLVG